MNGAQYSEYVVFARWANLIFGTSKLKGGSCFEFEVPANLFFFRIPQSFQNRFPPFDDPSPYLAVRTLVQTQFKHFRLHSFERFGGPKEDLCC